MDSSAEAPFKSSKTSKGFYLDLELSIFVKMFEFYLANRGTVLFKLCVLILEVKMSLYGDEDVIIKEKESQVAGWSQVSTLHCLFWRYFLTIIFDGLSGGLNCNFFSKKDFLKIYLSLFLQFLPVIETLDPEPVPYPDSNSMNPDPQHWLERWLFMAR